MRRVPHQPRILKLEVDGLECPSVSHHHLKSLEHTEMIVSLWICMGEGCRCVDPEKDLGRLAAKRHQDSNIRRRRETGDLIEAFRYHTFDLVSWRLEGARRDWSKGLRVGVTQGTLR